MLIENVNTSNKTWSKWERKIFKSMNDKKKLNVSLIHKQIFFPYTWILSIIIMYKKKSKEKKKTKKIKKIYTGVHSLSQDL